MSAAEAKAPPPLPAHLEPHREAMRRLAEAMIPRCDGWFHHDGVIHSAVKPYQIAAYIKARFEGRLEFVTVAAVALVGAEAVEKYGNEPGWLGWRIARAYVWKMQQVEASLPVEVRAPGNVPAERAA